MTTPTKRTTLDLLTKTRLIELSDSFGLGVTPRTSKAGFVDVIARARRVCLENLLPILSRDELKLICAEHALDTTGRRKAVIMARILGKEPVAGAQKPKAAAKTKTRELPRTATAAASKASLTEFVDGTIAGYRTKTFQTEFVRDLLDCYGCGDESGAEVPATLKIDVHGKRTEVAISAWWADRRVLIQVLERDTNLDQAWQGLLNICLQVVPQYVLVTNLQYIRLYDLGNDREEPRLSIKIADIPRHSEAFAFLGRDWEPGTRLNIVDEEKVSLEVAVLVGKIFRSLKRQHPDREHDVAKFTLQCIVTMFAEDVGLLPDDHFTNILYRALDTGETEQIAELFRLMSTDNNGTEIAYFNGGLFHNPITLALTKAQLRALTTASESDWRHVDPHIFGSVFQSIMGDEERHATGAHYTAKEDIMRVVGPTIVDPLRKRLDEASTLTELKALREEIKAFRVLDPACGSGNFLYVAFQQLYDLETDLLFRMYEFQSVMKNPPDWIDGVPSANFYGIDKNEFAVELAKATLNIAKKIAFDRRRTRVVKKFKGQVPMNLDPSLPLTNLDDNIRYLDALFCDWPDVDAIVGNPPFLGYKAAPRELGVAYVSKLRAQFPNMSGLADLCVYWFRRAHAHLQPGGRAGLVGTSSIRVGNSREAGLDYIIKNGGTITDAVSAHEWPGEATVYVSMVNWINGPAELPFRLMVDGVQHECSSIAPHLQLHTDTSGALAFAANKGGVGQGVNIGTNLFILSPDVLSDILNDSNARNFVRPLATGGDLLCGRLATEPRYVVDLRECHTLAAAKRSGTVFDYVEAHVKSYVQSRNSRESIWKATWWKPRRAAEKIFGTLGDTTRMLVCSAVASRPIFVFISRDTLANNSLLIFSNVDDYSFGIVQSSLHWEWAKAQGTKLGGIGIRYNSDVWDTFPWPQEAPEWSVEAVAQAGRRIRNVRRDLMKDNAWNLRDLHRAAEISGPHPLKQAQRELDEAVAKAYGQPEKQPPLEFLLGLNLVLAEDEQAGVPIQGPGLPKDLDPKDPRWFSADCISPPPLPEN